MRYKFHFLTILTWCLSQLCTYGQATPPTPDLTSTCTGTVLPVEPLNPFNPYTSNIMVGSIPITVSFSDYLNAQTSLFPLSPLHSCGSVPPGGNLFEMGNNSDSSSMKISFNKRVSNVKVYIAVGSRIGENVTFTLKDGCSPVSPTISVSPDGNCNSNWSINNATNTITCLANMGTVPPNIYKGIIINLGGVWFDEILITKPGSPPGDYWGGMAFGYCVGAATTAPHTANYTAYLSLCPGQLPTTWNGINIPAGATSNPAFATYTTTTALGCDSIVTLNLTVNPSVTSTVSLTRCASQLPTIWNGINIPAGATSNPAYTTYTTTSTAGCDSIVTLNLTVNPGVTSTTSLIRCASQLPTTWNGINIPAGATSNPAFTTYTTTNAAGCDSTVTLNLIINPNVTSTATLALCTSQLPTTWNGITIPAGATNNPAFTTYTTTNAAGCDSTVTLNLTITPSTASVASLTLCANQLPTSWNGITIPTGSTSNTAFTTYTTTNAAGCDSTVTLNLTITPSTTSVASLTLCANQLPTSWNGITIPTGSTSNPVFTTYTTANAAGCDSIVTLNLAITPSTTSVASLALCANQLPASWNGIAIPAGTTSNPAFATYTATNAAGCDSTVTLNLTVNPNVISTASLSLCASQLPASWNGIAIPTGTTSNPAFTTYTTTNAAGCDSIVTLNLTVSPSVTSTASLTLCTNQLPTTWNGIVIPAGTTSNPAYTTYTTTNAAGCDSTVTLNLTINPNVTSTALLSLCASQLPASWNGIAISAGATSNPAYTTYTTTSATGCDSTVTLNLTINPTLTNSLSATICEGQAYTLGTQNLTASGIYTQIFTTTNTCDSIVTLTLTVNPLPLVSIVQEGSERYCLGDTITLKGVGADSYQWSWKRNGFALGAGDTKAVTIHTGNQVIVVEGADNYGCRNTAETTIKSEGCCQLLVPNAFSPNGDGLNDGFGPETEGNPRGYAMHIYNRWGQMIYVSYKIEQKWNGTYKGQPASSDTYYYLITGECASGEQIKLKGDLILLR